MKEIFLFQALFFFITGVWPLIHIRSFMKVTGPKQDLWLVKTVGVLVTAISIGIFVSYFHEKLSTGVVVIALLSCLFLMGIDIFYATNGVISKIYLFDAIIEILLAINAVTYLILK